MSHTYGHIDLLNLLTSAGGEINGVLTDSGMERPYHGAYEVTNRQGEGADEKITIQANSRSSPITLARFVPLDVGFLIFVGMYAGDGNKVGDIGFGQKNLILMAYLHTALGKLFGESFTLRYSITEDTKYFDSDEMREVLKVLRQTLDKEGLTAEELDRELFVEKEFLRREVSKKLSALKIQYDPQAISVTVSPLKGARAAGQSSREDLIGLDGSRPYLPILLKLVDGVMDSVVGNTLELRTTPEAEPWLVWDTPPQNAVGVTIDTRSYILTSSHCRYFTSTGNEQRLLVDQNEGLLSVAKQNGRAVSVFPQISITPPFCVTTGLYFAEGGTPKERLLSFHSGQQEGGLSVEFVSSVDDDVAILVKALSQIFSDINDIFSYWKIKIGSAYISETGAVGEKIGVPILRRGAKGQGKSRTFEVAGHVKHWATETFPTLGRFEDHFSHMEFTGAGIVRSHLAFSSSIAPLLFALMYDVAFDWEELASKATN